MGKGKLAVVVVLICAIAGGLWYFHDLSKPQESAGEYANLADYSSAYQAQDEIKAAQNAYNNAAPAKVIIGRKNDRKKEIALTFDGMADRGVMEGLVRVLQKYHLTGTFFLEGQNAAKDDKLVAVIDKAGFTLGNYSYIGISRGERLSKDQQLQEFCRTQKVLKVTSGKAPELFKFDKTVYTTDLLRAAKSSGLNYAVRSTAFVPVQDLTTEAAVEKFVASLKPGSILSVQLGIPADIKYETGKTDERPAVDKKPNAALKVTPASAPAVVDVVNWLCAALVKDGYTVVPVLDFQKDAVNGTANPATAKPIKKASNGFLASLYQAGQKLWGVSTAYAASRQDLSAGVSDTYLEELKKANGGRLAAEEKMLYTTERAVPFTFTGFSKADSLNYVLQALKESQGKGTFFVSERELQRNAANIDKIAASGQELAIAVYPKATENFADVCRDILRVRQALQSRYGVTTYLVKQSSGAVSDVTKEAVSALHLHLIGATMNVVQTRHKDVAAPEQVLHDIFGKSVYSVGRGWLINIRTDFYAQPKMAAEVFLLLKRRKVDNVTYNSYDDIYGKNPHNDSAYKLKTVGSILSDKAKRWTYPVPEDKYLPITERQPVLASDSLADLLTAMHQRYIGAMDVDAEDRVIGFKNDDIAKFDMTGRIHTDDSVIFITFDDWGTDESINKLLYVLNKHHAAGNFFVLTHNVPHNPNLLRAIAEGGHDIGSHTNLHKPMVVRDPKTNKQVPTMNYVDFYDDMNLSWTKLVSVAGDVEIGGKPALTHYFRPPTLAISELGMEAIFQNGFTYSVSGSTSTEDYSAKNLQQMIKRITDGLYYQGKVRKGAVLVMHMSDVAKYTALALDYVLTANDKRAASDPAKFTAGRLSDYLKDGYSQATPVGEKKKRQIKWW